MSCKKRAAGAGGGGGEEPDLSGSEGLEANTELPRASLEQGGLRYLGGPPRGQMVSGAAQVVALGRERVGALGGEVGKTRSHPGQSEGAQCPAERDLGHDKADQKNAAIITIRVTARS